MCTQGPLDSFWQLFSFPRFRSNSASSDRKRLLVNAALGQCPLPGIICYYDMNRHVWRSLHVNVLLGGGGTQSRERRAEQPGAQLWWDGCSTDLESSQVPISWTRWMGRKWKKDQKDSIPPPHCLLHHPRVPVFPAYSFAFCYKQDLNHPLLKAGGGKKKKNIQRLNCW